MQALVKSCGTQGVTPGFNQEVARMLDTLRKPVFIVALVLIIVTVLLELGSGLVKSLGNARESLHKMDDARLAATWRRLAKAQIASRNGWGTSL